MPKREKQINNLVIKSQGRMKKGLPTTIYTVYTPDGRAWEEFEGFKDGKPALERAEDFCRKTTDFVRKRA